MGIKSIAARWLASYEKRQVEKWANRPWEKQQETLQWLLKELEKTAFGQEHNTAKIQGASDWSSQIPVRDYEGLKPWVDRMVAGEPDILWPGKPKYFCKTSGTTSGTKYIPMSAHGIQAQIKAARSALLCYIHETGNSNFTDGKMIFLQGSPELTDKNGIGVGRLSGIVAHHVPSYLQRNRMPSLETNCIDDWEEKVDAIVDETMSEDMRLISGIPPWVQMYFERLLVKSGKKSILEVFPNFSVFAHGGVNYAPYKSVMERLIGAPIDSIETYPASEGFIAFQDSQKQEGLLLNLDAGIFYEFIPAAEVGDETPTRLTLNQVELGVNYAIVLNTSSGLWGYLIGDTVKFVSLKPYRIVVTGRIKHFISAFGEHVIAEEVEQAMAEVSKECGVEVLEFHVAPQVSPVEGLPYHEWFIESDHKPEDEFAVTLDNRMRALNAYYNDLITGNVLRPLVVRHVERHTFNQYMESQGKLGGQNKLPRLSNDRAIADRLIN